MTQKEVVKWSVHLETVDKRYRELVRQSYKGEWKCLFIDNEDTFTRILWDMHTKKVVKFHLENELKMCNNLNKLWGRVINDLKGKSKMECPFGNKQGQGPCLTFTQEECNSSAEKKFFFLSGFSFTTIHESQDCRGRGRAFL